jgi:hypothetical protein
MEKASILWALLLSPFIWSLKNKHYVIGFGDRGQTLYLFRLSLGLLGVGKATGFEKLAVKELRELEYREHFLTASFSFRKPDGIKVKLFVPVPSKKNAKEIYGAIQKTL